MLTVSEHGLDAVRRELHAMQRRTHDLSPAWEEWLTWWADTNREQFSSRGRRWRTPWRPLAPSTVAEKRRKGYLSDTLVRTSEMRTSLTGRPLGIEHIRAHDVEAGTGVYPAHFHQRGTRRMPARPLLNARQVAAEGAAGSAVLSWIVSGTPNIGGTRLER
jgi:hypothetical protein